MHLWILGLACVTWRVQGAASHLSLCMGGCEDKIQVREAASLQHRVLCPAGTDINGALQRGIQLLNDWAHNDIEDRSVSSWSS